MRFRLPGYCLAALTALLAVHLGAAKPPDLPDNPPVIVQTANEISSLPPSPVGEPLPAHFELEPTLTPQGEQILHTALFLQAHPMVALLPHEAMVVKAMPSDCPFQACDHAVRKIAQVVATPTVLENLAALEKADTRLRKAEKLARRGRLNEAARLASEVRSLVPGSSLAERAEEMLFVIAHCDEPRRLESETEEAEESPEDGCAWLNCIRQFGHCQMSSFHDWCARAEQAHRAEVCNEFAEMVLGAGFQAGLLTADCLFRQHFVLPAPLPRVINVYSSDPEGRVVQLVSAVEDLKKCDVEREKFFSSDLPCPTAQPGTSILVSVDQCPPTATLEEKLAQTVTVQCVNATLGELLHHLRQTSGVPIVVHGNASTRQAISLCVVKVPLRSLVEMLARPMGCETCVQNAALCLCAGPRGVSASSTTSFACDKTGCCVAAQSCSTRITVKHAPTQSTCCADQKACCTAGDKTCCAATKQCCAAGDKACGAAAKQCCCAKTQVKECCAAAAKLCCCAKSEAKQCCCAKSEAKQCCCAKTQVKECCCAAKECCAVAAKQCCCAKTQVKECCAAAAKQCCCAKSEAKQCCCAKTQVKECCCAAKECCAVAAKQCCCAKSEAKQCCCAKPQVKECCAAAAKQCCCAKSEAKQCCCAKAQVKECCCAAAKQCGCAKTQVKECGCAAKQCGSARSEVKECSCARTTKCACSTVTTSVREEKTQVEAAGSDSAEDAKARAKKEKREAKKAAKKKARKARKLSGTPTATGIDEQVTGLLKACYQAVQSERYAKAADLARQAHALDSARVEGDPVVYKFSLIESCPARSVAQQTTECPAVVVHPSIPNLAPSVAPSFNLVRTTSTIGADGLERIGINFDLPQEGEEEQGVIGHVGTRTGSVCMQMLRTIDWTSTAESAADLLLSVYRAGTFPPADEKGGCFSLGLSSSGDLNCYVRKPYKGTVYHAMVKDGFFFGWTSRESPRSE